MRDETDDGVNDERDEGSSDIEVIVLLDVELVEAALNADCVLIDDSDSDDSDETDELNVLSVDSSSTCTTGTTSSLILEQKALYGRTSSVDLYNTIY